MTLLGNLNEHACFPPSSFRVWIELDFTLTCTQRGLPAFMMVKEPMCPSCPSRTRKQLYIVYCWLMTMDHWPIETLLSKLIFTQLFAVIFELQQHGKHRTLTQKGKCFVCNNMNCNGNCCAKLSYIINRHYIYIGLSDFFSWYFYRPSTKLSIKW